MPLYEYQCKKCKNIEEHLVSFSGNGPSKCKTCGGTLDRMMSRTFVFLKGGSAPSDPTQKIFGEHHDDAHTCHEDDHHH